MASGNIFINGINEIKSSTGSYKVPANSFSGFPDTGLLLGDVFLLSMTLSIVLFSFKRYSSKKSFSNSSPSK